MSHAENVIRRVLHITMIFTAVLAVLVILSCAAFADTNSAPEWMPGALKEDSQTVTLGNPYTPKPSITAKWTDPDGDKLVYWYSVDDGTPALCTDYNGSEGQLPYFAYTFTSLGTHTLKIWVSDNKTQSDPYVATVTVVDPKTYEYTMTINAAPRNADLSFYECDGFNEDGEDIPGAEISPSDQTRGDTYHTYTIKLKAGTYSFRGKNTAGNELGGMTFQVPNEAKTAGSSETVIYIKELDVGCTTKYDGTSYCTTEHFRPHVTTNGHEVVYGSTNMNSGITYYRTMVLAASNDITYQRYVEALDPVKAYGYTDGGFGNNTTVSAGGSAQKFSMDLAKAKELSIKAPEGSDVRLFFQRNNYCTLDKTNKMLVSKTSDGSGTETWKFSGPLQFGSYTWRVSKEGRLTRAGYTSDAGSELDLTGDDPCGPESTVTTAGKDHIDNSMILNVNSSNVLELGVGEEFILRPFRAWQIISDPGSNCIIEPDFHTEVVKSQDVLEIQEGSLGNASGNRVKLTARKEGVAVVKVRYDAMRIYSNTDDGVFGACDRERQGFVVVKVGEKNGHIVHFGLAGSAARNTQWDADFDTCYFTGESGSLDMKPISDDGIRSVGTADPETFSFTDAEEQNGRYTVPVSQGSTVVRIVTNSGEEHYQIVRGCRYSYTLTNLSREGKDPAAGDTVKLHLNGLYMPVPKMAGVYNPGYESTGKVSYITEDGETIQSPGSQYDFISTQDLTFTIPSYGDGRYELKSGQMSISIMAAPNCLGIHRSIPDGGLNTMFNAVSNGWRGSALEDLEIPLGKTGHGLGFTGVISGSNISLFDSDGTELTPDSTDDGVIAYSELPDGTYSYTVTLDEYKPVTGEAVLTSGDSGQKEIKIEQKMIDEEVEAVISEINALPEAGELTKEDIASVSSAKADYDALSDDQKRSISQEITDKLNSLLREAAILSDDAVMNVIALIKAMPDASSLTLENKDEVNEADEAFKALKDDQKQLVDDNLQKRLAAAVRQMNTLVTDKANQDAADLAEQYIKALPAIDAMTLGDKDAVDQAKSYYDSLTRTQKALVPDSSKLALTDAVNKIKELEEQARQAEEEARQAEEAARRAEEKYRQDKAAAEAAEQLITDLPALSAMTLNDKDKVESAKAKYDNLTDDQKALVSDSNKQLLQNALVKIDELEELARQTEEEAKRAAEEQAERERQKAEQEKKNKAAAEAAEQLITGLPALNDMTLNDKEKVESAKAKYDNLTDDQKALVSDSNKQLLHNTLDKIDELEELARQAEEEAKRAAEEQAEKERQKAEQEKKNKAAAEAAEQMITQIPNVDDISLEDKEKIEDAKAKYDSLTDDQKALVADSNKQKLQSAIDKVGELEEQARKAAEEQAEREREQAEQAEKDKAAAESVLQKIVELPALQELTLNDKTKVEQIRVSFDGLTELQKALVPYDMQVILQSAESRIKELEQINIAKAYKTKIKAKALKGHKAKITWKKLSKVTGYKVYRANKKKGKYKLIKTLSSPKKVTFTNSKLKKDNYYYYKVLPYTRINGAVYKGKWSNISRIKAK